jgi:hypothetical protein
VGAAAIPSDSERVRLFTYGNLAEALSNRILAATEIEGLPHVRYLHDYLASLGAKRLIVEQPYIDRDYLEDYTAHYATCYSTYDRWCKRVHFFRRPIGDEEFDQIVLGRTSEETRAEFEKDYLGFVVARPLPQAIIGRTVLRTFDDDGGHRVYRCVRTYKVNLYGLPLELPSLAFQEQDTVLGACATVALWSAFQKTADLFGTPTPTPSAITRAASDLVHYGRSIPSDGLNVLEICRAVRQFGLEPEVIDVTPDVPVASVAYGYLRMGLPVILGVQVEGMGLHAITLAGYSMEQKGSAQQSEIPGGEQFIPMCGLRIDGLYGHDDQIGPFSRLKIVPPVSLGGQQLPGHLEGSWQDRESGRTLSLFPQVIIVPVYHKIRLKFLDVLQWVTPLHDLFRVVCSPGIEALWDIHLTFSNGLKSELRAAVALPEPQRRNVLLAAHPRFAWRAVLRLDGVEAADVLLDATGIARSFPAYGMMWRMPGLADEVRKRLENPQLSQLLVEILSKEVFDFLLASVRQPDQAVGLAP